MLEPQSENPVPGSTADRASRALFASSAASPTPAASAAELGRVRAVIEALPEAVFVTESDGTLRFTNPAADRLFAAEPIHDRADLLARFEEIVPAGPTRAALPDLDDVERNVTVRPRDQPNRWFTLRAVPLDPDRPIDDEVDEPGGDGGRASDGVIAAAADARGSAWDVQSAEDFPVAEDPNAPDPAPGRTVFVLRDITNTSELRPVREAFLAILAHELRTPITTIYAGSSLLARRPTLSPPATRTLANDINAEAARLYDLVEDLLVLARLERRVLDLIDEPVLLQRAVESTIRTVDDRLGEGMVERRGDADVPPVHGDATYVEHACRNLVMASVRYAEPDPDSRLSIEVRSVPGAGEVTVAVLDRGPHLSPAELERAFELPAASASERLAASGVGPFVCRHLVEAMGGRVWARNRAGGGIELGFALRVDQRA